MNKIVDRILNEVMKTPECAPPGTVPPVGDEGVCHPGDGSVYLGGDEGVCYPGEFVINPEV